MGCVPNGANGAGGGEQFALVIYIPDPLGRFLDTLRLELAPGCKPHAHVSVLPPRTLSCPWRPVAERARAAAEEFPAFQVEMDGISTFPVTNVIYIEVAQGKTELYRMHQALANHDLAFPEPFPYHPHITLAQELPA